MGMELVVHSSHVVFPQLLTALAARGLNGLVAMVDGQLQPMGATVPEAWRDVRLRFPVGTVTLTRRPDGVAVVVFGNADAGLQDAQRLVAEVLQGPVRV